MSLDLFLVRFSNGDVDPIPEQLNADLRRLAEKRGSPMSDVVVEILEKGLREAAKVESRRGKA